MSSVYSRAQLDFTVRSKNEWKQKIIYGWGYVYGLQESLKKCLDKKDIEYVKPSFAQYNTNNFDVKSTLDQTFREFLFKTVFKADACVDFVQLSVQAVRNNLVTPALPINLLGDIFDAVTLDESEKLFYYVEDNVGKWISIITSLYASLYVDQRIDCQRNFH